MVFVVLIEASPIRSSPEKAHNITSSTQTPRRIQKVESPILDSNAPTLTQKHSPVTTPWMMLKHHKCRTPKLALVVGVFIVRALLFGVYIRAPDFWKLSIVNQTHGNSAVRSWGNLILTWVCIRKQSLLNTFYKVIMREALGTTRRNLIPNPGPYCTTLGSSCAKL